MKLLSCRGSMRVICAPARYGKTVLAAQYAEQVFDQDKVAWVDATQLTFLLALDTPLSEEFNGCYLVPTAQRSLFVFDGCPYLSTARFNALAGVLNSLIEAGHEVVLTTTDIRWAKLKELDPLVINARELLLDEDERSAWDALESRQEKDQARMADQMDEKTCKEPPHNSAAAQKLQRPDSSFDLGIIPGFRSKDEDALQDFYHALTNSDVHSEQDAIAQLAVVLGSGALHELNRFTQAFGTSSINHLEQHAPHCGVKRLEPMFQAAPLSDEHKFSLVQGHLASLTEALPVFSSEDELVSALIDCFMRRGEVLLAAQFVCGLNDNDRKAAYFDRHGRSFLLDARPLALLKLATSLPRTFFSTPDRWQVVIIALGLVGDGKQASLALDAYLKEFANESKRESSEGTRKGAPAYRKPISPNAIELFAALARITFEMDFDRDPEALLPCVHARIEEVRMELQYSASPLNFTLDMLEMIESLLLSPYDAITLLDRIAARGYSLRECLGASSLFTQLLIFFWGTKLFGEEDPESAEPPSRTATSKPRPHKDAILLQRLEDHIARLLARQETALGSNCYELFLFEKAQYIFADRVYLFVSDDLLQRIETGQTSLVDQRRQWRLQQRTGTARLKGVAASRKQGKTKALRINTLGRFEIESRDPSITIQAKVRKQLRLLISLLAIHEGREVSRPWIQRVMWPDAADRNAKQNLYSMWSLLNKSITNAAGECPFFESFPQSMALNEQLVETDIHLLVDRCKQLRSKTLDTQEYEIILEELEDIYRGPLLPGLDTAEVVAHRKRYQDHLLDALIQSGMNLKKQGKTTLALRFFRFAFENEPTREDVCYQLMMVLWKLGRHGEAMNEYFVCHHALDERFGLECSTRLQELYQSILNDAS